MKNMHLKEKEKSRMKIAIMKEKVENALGEEE